MVNAEGPLSPPAQVDIRSGEVMSRAVAVVIPARDEEFRIGPTIAAMIAAPDVSEVVVVDDRSSDRTAAVSAGAGARVVTVGERPDNWAGKTWAVQRGVDATTAPWVLVLDADTRPDSGLPAALVARAIDDRLDLLTVAGSFRAGRRSSRWLHAAMLATLVYRYGPPGTGGRVLANGQCMLLRRDGFQGRGGMSIVAGSLVEDVALARSTGALGGRVAFVDASDLLEVEPYESFGATWSGWGRSLGLPGVDPVTRRVLDVVVLALVMPWPIVRLLGGRGDAIDLAAIAARVGTLVGMRPAYRARGASYWLSPLADPVAITSLAIGVVKRRRSWRGRTYWSRGATAAQPARTADR